MLVSLVLHALGIVLLLTIRAADPPRANFSRATAVVSPYRGPMPVKPPPRVPPLHTRPIATRTFRVPDRLPQPAPPSNPAIPDPPVMQSPDVRSAYSAPPLVELPPPPRPPLPVRRVVVTGAFDATIPSNQAAAHREITTGAFGDAGIAAAASRSNQASDSPISSSAEILSKPRPVYTDEARHLKIEGEVLLEVLFSASGETRVLRMIQGLGHGLDENAITAARAIQFRPAKRGDTAADSTAVVHIVFQLAY